MALFFKVEELLRLDKILEFVFSVVIKQVLGLVNAQLHVAVLDYSRSDEPFTLVIAHPSRCFKLHSFSLSKDCGISLRVKLFPLTPQFSKIITV